MSMKKKKKKFKDLYGEDGESVMYATATKLAMEGKDPKLSKIVKQLRKSVKSHGKQADYIEKINEKNCGCGQTPCKTYGKDVKEESNPRIPRKKGQPANSKKHSDLYTDENPKGTIHGLGFKDVATAKASVAKIRKSSRSHAHKIQAAVAMEQRAREMGKSAEAAIYRKYINSMKKKTNKMNESKIELQYDSNKGFDVNNIRDTWKQGKETIKNVKIKLKGGEVEKEKPKKTVADKVTDAINTYKSTQTEGSLHKWFKGSKSKDGKGGWVNVVTGGTCASDEPGEGTPKCVSSAKRASMTKAERLSAARRKKKADPGQQSKSGAAKPTYVSTDSPRKKKKMKEEIIISEEGKSVFSTPSLDKLKKIKDYKNNADKVFGRKPIEKAHYEPEGEIISEVKDKKGKGSGTKDACYHKVKSRYSVWPSAYASGALVKCRKVGAANWGNSKKEEFDPSELSFQQFMEKCWKGYEKKGMKTMFGKRYPNCVKKEEKESKLVPTSTSTTNSSTSTLIPVLRDKTTGKVINLGGKRKVERQYHDSVELKGDQLSEHHQKDKNGNTIPHEDTTPSSVEEGAAWTKKSGKNPSGGLNEKGRKSYERENPGSDLKRPSKKVGNKRRASFCARMRGMKKKLTSAKTARDPDSRINKSLRAWNC